MLAIVFINKLRPIFVTEYSPIFFIEVTRLDVLCELLAKKGQS